MSSGFDRVRSLGLGVARVGSCLPGVLALTDEKLWAIFLCRFGHSSLFFRTFDLHVVGERKLDCCCTCSSDTTRSFSVEPDPYNHTSLLDVSCRKLSTLITVIIQWIYRWLFRSPLSATLVWLVIDKKGNPSWLPSIPPNGSAAEDDGKSPPARDVISTRVINHRLCGRAARARLGKRQTTKGSL